MDAAIAGVGEGPPRVVVTVRIDNGELLLRVADSGPGVDPACVPEMFSTWLDDHTVGRSGWAWSRLALVGQTVRRYGGSIDVTWDGGAVLTVRLPVR